MTANEPRVSIGLAVYNGGDFLSETLDSLLAQTFTDYELIISDNGSTDTTEQIAHEYAQKDSRIVYYRNARNMGMAWNYNHLFQLARCEYFKWADHDDICAPTYLEECVRALDADPSLTLCDTTPVDIDERGNLIGVNRRNLGTGDPSPHRRFYNLLRERQDRLQINGVIRSSALRRTPGFGSYATADLVLMAHLVLMGPFHRVPKDLFFYRHHPKQAISLGRYLRYARLDPSRRGRITLPEWEAYWGLIKCVAHVPLPSSQRLWCYLYLLRWPFWNRNWVLLAKDLVRAATLKVGYGARWSFESEA